MSIKSINLPLTFVQVSLFYNFESEWMLFTESEQQKGTLAPSVCGYVCVSVAHLDTFWSTFPHSSLKKTAKALSCCMETISEQQFSCRATNSPLDWGSGLRTPRHQRCCFATAKFLCNLPFLFFPSTSITLGASCRIVSPPHDAGTIMLYGKDGVGLVICAVWRTQNIKYDDKMLHLDLIRPKNLLSLCES